MIDENCVKWLRLIFCRNLYPDVSRCPGLADAEGLGRRSASPRTRMAVADTVGASIMPFCAPR